MPLLISQTERYTIPTKPRTLSSTREYVSVSFFTSCSVLSHSLPLISSSVYSCPLVTVIILFHSPDLLFTESVELCKVVLRIQELELPRLGRCSRCAQPVKMNCTARNFISKLEIFQRLKSALRRCVLLLWGCNLKHSRKTTGVTASGAKAHIAAG